MALVLTLALTGAAGLLILAWLAINRPELPLANPVDVRSASDALRIVLSVVAGGSVLGAALGVAGARLDFGGPTSGLELGLFIALAIAFGVGLHQASGRYVAAVLTLRLQRRIPLRLLSFLDDAHRLGILREAGPIYQFRHAKLQDHLARTAS